MANNKDSNYSDNLKWHLSDDEIEILLTDFEYSLWRLFYTWIRWQEDCQRCISETSLSASEVTLLHVVRMRDRPKTIYELSRLLDRPDIPNIQYGVNKLIKLGYVKKINLKLETNRKTTAFEITEKGIKNTNNYAAVRKEICVKIFREMQERSSIDFQQTTSALATMRSIYDESSRIASMHAGEVSEE